MSKIKEFRFRWTDAWNSIDDGYDSILETDENGNIIIKALVNNKPEEIKLTGREKAFIQQLEKIGVPTWNGYQYEQWLEDGTHWSLSIVYDDTWILTKGYNGYPKEFPRFLELLHTEYGLPKCRCESFGNMRKDIAATKISRLEKDARAIYS